MDGAAEANVDHVEDHVAEVTIKRAKGSFAQPTENTANEFYRAQQEQAKAQTALALIQNTEALTKQRQMVDLERQADRTYELDKMRIFHGTVKTGMMLTTGLTLSMTMLLRACGM